MCGTHNLNINVNFSSLHSVDVCACMASYACLCVQIKIVNWQLFQQQQQKFDHEIHMQIDASAAGW